MTIYTHKDWLNFKKEFSLKNKDVAEIIGTSEQNVKMHCNSNKPLPTWAKAFIYSFKKTKELLTSKNENMK